MSEPLTPEQRDEALDIVAGVVAWQFHDTYERLAPEYGYETRPELAVPWKDVPAANRALMTATVKSILGDVFADRDSLRARIVELEGERDEALAVADRVRRGMDLALQQQRDRALAAEAKVLALEGVVSAARKLCEEPDVSGLDLFTQADIRSRQVWGNISALRAALADALPQDKEGEAER